MRLYLQPNMINEIVEIIKPISTIKQYNNCIFVGYGKDVVNKIIKVCNNYNIDYVINDFYDKSFVFENNYIYDLKEKYKTFLYSICIPFSDPIKYDYYEAGFDIADVLIDI